MPLHILPVVVHPREKKLDTRLMTSPPLACDPTILRSVAPPEVPYPGVLTAGEPGRYLVGIGDGPESLFEAGDDHVLGAIDLDRMGGRDVLVLPRVSTRLSGAASDAPTIATTPGQAVTLIVSLLRGGQRAEALGVESGEWWLTDEGRPVLAPGAPGDGPTWRLTARSVLERAREVPGIAPFADRAIGVMAVPEGYARAAAALEDEIFAAFSAEPLDAARSDRPAVAGAAWQNLIDGPRSDRSRRDRGADATDAGADPSPRPGLLHREVTGAVTRLVDGAIGRQVGDAFSALSTTLSTTLSRRRSAAKPRPRSRRPLLLVSGGVAVATLAVGWMLPWGDGAEGAGATAPVSGTSTASPPDQTRSVSTPDAVATEPVPAPVDDPNGAAIDALAQCLADDDPSTCRADVLERADALVPPGVASEAGPRTVTVLDDLGGVLVTRVEDPTGSRPAQIAVLVDRDDKRLVRDIYDVADQP